MRLGVWICSFLPGIILSQINFTSSPQLISHAEHFSGSVLGISDMNGDGKDDIVRLESSKNLSIAYQTAPGQPFRLRFFGTVSELEQWSLAIGDINQDGYNDMVFAANESPGSVYYSLKTGDSINYIKETLPGSAQAYSQASNLVDINNDGWLDFFLCNDLGENKIWANQGGKFSGNPVSWINFNTIPASDNSGNYGSVWSDFDRDGDLDLYVAKCKGGVNDPTDPRRVNTLYLNNGQNGYYEAAAPAGLAIGLQSWVAVTGDSDNDGDQDIFLMNHSANCQLLINNGSGIFTDVTNASGINYTAVGVQAAWIDFDNDGLLDLLISGNRHQIYLNKGNNKFELLASPLLGFHQIESFAIGDLNDDGKQDIYASYSLLFNQASHRPDAVWLNTSKNNHHFLKVRLNGSTSNLSAVGASVSLFSGNFRTTKEVHSGISYGTSQSLTLHFGLGNLSKIDSVVIRWPDRQREAIVNPFIDRTLVLTQNKCFAFDPVLDPGSKPALCKAGDSIVLTSPINGSYLWSNGSKNKSVSIVIPGIYQLRLTTLEGCTVHSNLLQIASDPRSAYKIALSDSILCSGDASLLTIPTSKKVIWNTGDTLNTIEVTQPGSYFGRIMEFCSEVNSDTIRIRTLSPGVTRVKNDTVGLGGKANLSAMGQSLSWFKEVSGGAALTTGNTYSTPPLDKTTTYYVQSILKQPGKTVSGGIKNFSGASKFHVLNFSGRLLFDAGESFILKSVKVYSDTPGLRQIDLLNSSGQVQASKAINLAAGEVIVDLNFMVPAGDGYTLSTNEMVSTASYGSKSPRLYRTEGAIDYPLKSGPVSIYGTNAGAGNYYYFYDWQIVYPELICTSERVPVQAVIRSVSITEFQNKAIKLFPNPARTTLNLEWSQGITHGGIWLEIINPQGKVVYRNQEWVTGNTHQLGIPALPGGVYLVKLKSPTYENIFRIAVLQ
ncbi:MAG: FG-GAP-like repeat-containing protein [Saprospiraceae bacterium]|nr:FG-GAP-like repeat-containing protein [Saprospiraceae bacterium]